MRGSSLKRETRWRGRDGTTALLAGLILAFAACLMLWSAPAKADDGSLAMNFDMSVMNLGTSTWANVIDPDNVPPDPPATLNATLSETGAVSTPAVGFIFPTKVIKNLDAGPLVVDAKIEISATAAITGTFDRDTGASSLTVPVQARISVNTAGDTGPPLGICKVTGFSLNLSTTGSMLDPGDSGATPPRDPHTYSAAAFAPTAREGAAIAQWPAGLPASVGDGGSQDAIVCPQVDGLIGGPGGIWMSGTAIPSAGPVQLPPTIAPTIASSPEPTTIETSAEFGFSQGTGETEPVTAFQCRLDSESDDDWENCGTGGTPSTKSYSGLAVGDHRFQVRASNDNGSGPVSTFDWTIEKEVVAPALAPKILTGPPADGTETAATFTFEKGPGEEQPVDKFQCKLDSAAAWTDCNSGTQSYTGLAVGDHKFEVRAGNAIGYGPESSSTWKVSEKVIPPPDKTCAEDPTQDKCLGQFGNLKITPKVKKVKRNKKAVFKVSVKNNGDGFAKGVKLCVKTPKKQIKPIGAKCRKVADLAPGKTAKVKFKVKATKKAKVGKKYKVTVKATATGLGAKSGKATVKIKK